MLTLKLPEQTQVGKRLPKEAFYEALRPTPRLKRSFTSDVDRITLSNVLTKESLDLSVSSAIAEIDALTITLKKPVEIDAILIAIARYMEQESSKKPNETRKLLFRVLYQPEGEPETERFAIYRVGRLYQTPNRDVARESSELLLTGRSLVQIWDAFCEQIALPVEYARNISGMTLDERLELQEQIVKLQTRVEKAAAAVARERQPRRKYDLHTKLMTLRSELQSLIGE